MVKATIDPCVLIKKPHAKLIGLVILQVGDSLEIEDKWFMTEEEDTARSFTSNPRNILTTDVTTFIGVRLHRQENLNIYLEQSDKTSTLWIPNSQKGLASEREKSQYIGVNYMPNIFSSVPQITPGN